MIKNEISKNQRSELRQKKLTSKNLKNCQEFGFISLRAGAPEKIFFPLTFSGMFLKAIVEFPDYHFPTKLQPSVLKTDGDISIGGYPPALGISMC